MLTSINSDTWDVHEQVLPYQPRFVGQRWESRRAGQVNVETKVDETLDGLRAQMDLTGFTRIENSKPEFVGGSAIIESWIRLRR